MANTLPTSNTNWLLVHEQWSICGALTLFPPPPPTPAAVQPLKETPTSANDPFAEMVSLSRWSIIPDDPFTPIIYHIYPVVLFIFPDAFLTPRQVPPVVGSLSSLDVFVCICTVVTDDWVGNTDEAVFFWVGRHATLALQEHGAKVCNLVCCWKKFRCFYFCCSFCWLMYFGGEDLLELYCDYLLFVFLFCYFLLVFWLFCFSFLYITLYIFWR